MGVSLSRYPKSSNHGDDWGTNILGHRHMVRDFPSYKALSIEFFFHGFSHGCSDDFCHGLLLRHLPEGWAHGRRAQQGHWRWRCGTQGRSQGAAGGWRRGWGWFGRDLMIVLLFWWFFAGTWLDWVDDWDVLMIFRYLEKLGCFQYGNGRWCGAVFQWAIVPKLQVFLLRKMA